MIQNSNSHGIASVKNISQENHEEIDVQDEQRSDGEPHIAHLDDGVFAIGPDNGAHRIEDDRIHPCKYERGDAESIPVEFVAPVVAVGIDHGCGCWKDSFGASMSGCHLQKAFSQAEVITSHCRVERNLLDVALDRMRLARRCRGAKHNAEEAGVV